MDCVLIKVEHISAQCEHTMSLEWFLKMTHCLYAVDAVPLNNQVNLKQPGEDSFAYLYPAVGLQFHRVLWFTTVQTT